MTVVYPVLLAGGAGTRLWPLSRKSYPKQFTPLLDDMTLFQDSAQRLTSSNIVDFAPITTVTCSDFRFIVAEQLQQAGIDPGLIVIEPQPKNTAPAVLAASVLALKECEDAKILVAASDHLMPDTEAFHEAVAHGIKYISDGKIVAFGIRPTHAETGYGYLELADESFDDAGVTSVLNFVEKPDFEAALEMFKGGKHNWNAGIFLFSAKDIINAFRLHANSIYQLVLQAVETSHVDLGFLRLGAEPWEKLEAISIDYAVMEKLDNLVSVPYSAHWSDLGDWNAVWGASPKDEADNVVCTRSLAIDCKQSLLRSDSHNQHIVGLGLENIVVIGMQDAVLVANKDRAQEVKKIIPLLNASGVAQAEHFPKDFRPWGWFESLVKGESFQVKRIFVKPGGSLSLQSHKFRSEHWVVVEGQARVTIDDSTTLLCEGQSVYVPVGAIHRLENINDTPMVLIEVQIGSYLGEDDIVRYDDVYKRK